EPLDRDRAARPRRPRPGVRSVPADLRAGRGRRGGAHPGGVVMNRDEIWAAIDDQRRAVAARLDRPDHRPWQEPSLCTGWTVRDVAAHLTLQQLGLRDVTTMMRQWRGSMDRTIAYMARHRAGALSTARIVAEIRATVGSRRHNLGVTYLETLS